MVCALGVAAIVSFAGIGSHSLWTPDEPRDAAVGKAMWTSGDLVVPRLNGRPFLEKPPLAWWAQTAAYRAFGAGDAAARVPSALFATLTLLATWAIGRRLGGPRAGWLAAGALAGMAEYGEDMGKAIVDPPLVFLVTLAYLGFVVLVTPPVDFAAQRRERWWAWLLIALAVPLAFLVKGVVGIGLALGPPILFLLTVAVTGRGGVEARADEDGTVRGRLAGLARLLGPLALLGVPLFVAGVLPWALALLHAGGWAALRECLVGNTVGRLLSTEAGRAYGHRQPFWYYLPAGAVALLPWSLAIPAAWRALLEKRTTSLQDWSSPPSSLPGDEDTGARRFAPRLLMASFVLGAGLLSLAASKRTLYLVPLLPALAVPIGLWLDRLEGPAPAAERRGDRATALLLLGLAAVLPLALAGLAATVGIAAQGDATRRMGGIPLAPLRGTLSWGHLAAGSALALAGSALLLARLLRHLRAGSTPSGVWLVAPFLVLTMIYQTAIKAAVEPLKNPHDLTAALARIDRIERLEPAAGPRTAPPPVVAYRPSETTEGIVSFDLGRTVQPLMTPEDLAAWLAGHPGGRVVLTAEALRHLPASLRGRLRLVYDETAAKASPFVIAAAGVAAP